MIVISIISLQVFCWIYKHEGKRMKPELRCHAVLCKRASEPSLIALKLVEHLQAALAEYKREKVAKQNTRLSGLITGCVDLFGYFFGCCWSWNFYNYYFYRWTTSSTVFYGTRRRKIFFVQRSVLLFLFFSIYL